MGRAFYTLTAALNLAWKGGLVVIALALVLARADREPALPRPERGDEIPGSVVVGQAVDRTRVVMKVDDERPFAHYALEDREGKELVLVSYSRTGNVLVSSGRDLAVRTGSHIKANGEYDLQATYRNYIYRLKINPGGTCGLTVLPPRNGPREALGITRDGTIVRDPALLD